MTRGAMRRSVSIGRCLASGFLVLSLVACGEPTADDDFIILQSGTTLESSGLLGHILPKYTETSGIEVRVVSVGTGHALKNAKNGDGDVVLTHSKVDEEAFVANGYGLKRYDVMRNDFVIVGPPSDPAGIGGLVRADEAFARIAQAKAPFASRADDSGTHKAELQIWQDAGIDATAESGQWYLETGSSMSATLTTALGRGAYTLVDRGTWLSYVNKSGLTVLVEGDPKLVNQYAAILVKPGKNRRVNMARGQAFIDWLTGEDGQKAIGSFQLGDQHPFIPNAKESSDVHANARSRQPATQN